MLPNIFITKNIANVQLCVFCFITTPPLIFSRMLFYLLLSEDVSQWGCSDCIHIQSLKGTLLIFGWEQCLQSLLRLVVFFWVIA